MLVFQGVLARGVFDWQLFWHLCVCVCVCVFACSRVRVVVDFTSRTYAGCAPSRLQHNQEAPKKGALCQARVYQAVGGHQDRVQERPALQPGLCVFGSSLPVMRYFAKYSGQEARRMLVVRFAIVLQRPFFDQHRGRGRSTLHFTTL